MKMLGVYQAALKPFPEKPTDLHTLSEHLSVQRTCHWSLLFPHLKLSKPKREGFLSIFIIDWLQFTGTGRAGGEKLGRALGETLILHSGCSPLLTSHSLGKINDRRIGNLNLEN